MILLEMDRDAHRLDAGLQDGAGRRSSCCSIRCLRQVDDVHLAAVSSAGRAPLPGPAARRRSPPRFLRPGVRGDVAAVVERAEDEDAGLAACRPVVVEPSIGGMNGAAAGGDDQLVVRLGDAVLAACTSLRGAVDLASPARRRAGVMPFSAYQASGLRKISLGSCDAVEHVGQQDAVVVAVGLVAEHRDVELLGAAARQDLLDGAGAAMPLPITTSRCLAIGYGTQISIRPTSSTTCRRSPLGAATSSSSTVSGKMSSTTASGTWMRRLGADREIRIGAAVAHQHQVDQLVRGIARPADRSAASACRPAPCRSSPARAAAGVARPRPSKW